MQEQGMMRRSQILKNVVIYGISSFSDIISYNYRKVIFIFDKDIFKKVIAFDHFKDSVKHIVL